MSEMSDEEEKVNGNGAEGAGDHQSLAKLSKELNNWRRRRTSSRPSRVKSSLSNEICWPFRQAYHN